MRLAALLAVVFAALYPLSAYADGNYYGAPYFEVGNRGSGPTISAAAEDFWENYLIGWGQPQGCSYTLDTAGQQLPAVARLDIHGNCGGWTEIDATPFSYDPPKNLGPCAPPSCPLGVGNPINAATGNKYQKEEDAVFGGLLQIKRYYNSDLNTLPGTFGPHWRHTYERRVDYASGATEAATLTRETGKRLRFAKVAGSWVPDPDVSDALIERNTGGSIAGWTVFSSDTLRYEDYDASGVLQSVHDGDGHHVLLAYSDAGTPPAIAPAAGLLLTVIDERGRKLSFDYDSVGRIEQVSLPDGGAISYAYDTTGRLSTATYPGGAPRQYWYNEPALTQNADLPNALTGISDEGGARYASFGYDAAGFAVSTVHGGGAEDFRIASHADGFADIVTPLGGSTNYQIVFSHGTAQLAGASALCPACGPLFSAKTYDANGFPDITVDFNGGATDQDFSSAGLETQRKEAMVAAKPLSCPAGSSYYQNDYGSGCNDGSCWASAPFPGGIDGAGLGYPGQYYSCPIPASPAAPALRTIQTDWHATLRVPTERRTLDAASGLVAKQTWTYNARGQALTLSRIDPATSTARTSTTAYCEQADITAGTCPLLGLVKSVDGPRTDTSDTVAYTYRIADEAGCAASPTTCAYRKGDLWKVADALGHVTETLAYDGAGRVLSVKDPGGVVTDFEYHPRGWLTARKLRGANGASEADDRITRMEYWPTGLVKKVIQPDGAYTAYAYDAAHRLTDVSDNAGNTIHYTLDNAGNRTKEDTKDPSGNLKRTLSRVYNQLGQLATQADADANPTDFAYDANGNAVTTTDALGRVTDNDYDPLNRLKRTLQDVGGIAAETKFEYDALDNLTKVVDPKGLDTIYTYNGLGDLTQLSSPDTGTTGYTYDSAGNRKTQTDARGVVSTYTYDALSRVTGIAYPDTSLDTAYAYDTAATACQAGETFAKGRLSSMTDASGGTQYCYDRFGDLVRKVQAVNGVAFTVRYAYTKAGQMSGVTYPDGTTVDYVRNALGQATEVGVTPPGGTRQVLLTGAAYAPFGPATGWTYGNGRQLSRPLDQDYRPVAIQDTAAGGLDLGFGFDAVGNLDELTLAGGSTPLVKFGYDALNRLTHYRDGPTNVAIETYAYDKTGNRTSFQNSAGTQAYAYPATSHRLSEVDGVARSYDAAGSTTAIGSGRQFVYNDAGRMAQVEASGVVTAAYDYNGKGERVRKVAGGTEVYTLYDEAGRWLGDYDDPDGPLQQVMWLDDLPVGVVPGASPQLHYIEPDHLGTPRVVIEPTRNVAVWKWDLKSEAFGNSTPNQDPDGDSTAFVFDMRFPGQRYDPASGLNYNYYRDYETATGRYPQSDPIGLKGGISSFGYAHSNPLLWTDPRGLSPVTCANIESRAGKGTTGTITCNGKGGYEIINCESACLKKCTLAHERQHVYDWAMRYGANSCANRARGDLPVDATAPPHSIITEDRFRAMTECRGYKIGKDCAQKIIDANCGCVTEAKAYADGSEKQRVRYSCAAYGL